VAIENLLNMQRELMDKVPHGVSELTARRMVAGLEDSTLLSEEDQLFYNCNSSPQNFLFLGKNFKGTIVIRHTPERA